MGPSSEPWGTPNKSFGSDDIASSIFTQKDLSSFLFFIFYLFNTYFTSDISTAMYRVENYTAFYGEPNIFLQIPVE